MASVADSQICINHFVQRPTTTTTTSIMSWFSSSKGYESDEFEETATPFWETAVVTLTDGERRKPNYYEGLIPLWPHLGQLMVRDDFETRRVFRCDARGDDALV